MKEDLISTGEGVQSTPPVEATEPARISETEEKESLQTLYDGTFKTIEEGQILKGTVIEITPEYVTVDVGYKCEGQIPIQEFQKRRKGLDLKVGDRIDVLVERKDTEEGVILLSKEKADRANIWKEITKSFRDGTVMEGEVVSKVKGGLSVDLGGVNGFLPGSQIDLRPIRNLDEWVGQRVRFKVIKFNRKRNNIVLSRRLLLEEQRKVQREETLKNLKEGDLVEGTVKNLTDYGAFIDIGGVDGLLHITDMSWGRIAHPSEKLSVGQRVKVKVLRYDREKEKISLGLKQAQPDPWNSALEKYPPGTRVKGKAVNITDYGVFVELEEGVEGLVHISEMTWSKKYKHPSKMVQVGDRVEVMVLDCDPVKRRISLGMKQIEPNPWTLLAEKYPVGTKVVGKVKTITDFGIFIGIDEEIDGLVHVSEMSWTKKIKHASELCKKGQGVEAVVLNIDSKNERFSLGIKQLTPDPWKEVDKRYRKGDIVTGKVTNVTDFGVFVELEDGIEGLVHVSEMSREKVGKPSDVVKVGDTVSAVIIHVDPQDRRIGLSMKGYKEKIEKAEVEKYISNQGPTVHSLGALIQEEIEKRAEGLSPKKKEG